MKKNRVCLCIALAFLIILFTFFSTFMWYKFFDKNTEEKPIVNQLYISNNAQQVVEHVGVDDENDINNASDAYSFSVENTSKRNLTYQLKINEIAPSLLTDGCMQEDLLTRDQLIYQLKCNGSVITKESMTNIKDNTIDIKTIKAGAVNNYELTFWVDHNQKDYLNKHYHYEINLSV